MSLDTKSFGKACLELYAPGLVPENFIPRSYEFIRAFVPSEFMACGVLRTSKDTLEIGFDHAHPDLEPAMEALGRLMGNYDLYRWDPDVNAGRPFCRSHFYTLRQFRQLDLYSEVYRRLGVDNHCALHVRTDPDEVMFFGIERAGGPDFSQEELDVLELAQAHLANAYALAKALASASSEVAPETLAQAGLTPREAETLWWLDQGKSNGEIAALMGIGLHTVKAHVASVFDKAGVCNRHAASLWARQTCTRIGAQRRGDLFVSVPARPDAAATPLQSGMADSGGA